MSAKISRTIFIVILLIALILITFIGFMNGFEYVRSQNQRITNLERDFEDNKNMIDAQTEDSIEINIPRAATVDDIAELLKEKSLIKNTFIFKIISKFNGFDGQYQSGTHYLTPDLSYDEIMFVLARDPETITVTIPEGLTYKQMQQRMLDAGLKIDVQYMDDLVQRPNKFIDYPFVRDISVHADRQWLLQGYLWPDTYNFDSSMDEEMILQIILNNTRNKLANEEYKTRAAELGLTMDQVITLASIVQAEGNDSEMYKISRVFLNRLVEGMSLQSCATINYLRLEDGEEPVFWVKQSDLDRFSSNPYNTYTFDGLPPGPINNPGLSAIEGVLWPATERTWENAENYFYFCADGKGGNVFAQTAEEHQQNVDHYSSINAGN